MHPSKRPQRGLQPYSESAIKIRDRLPDTACLAFASGLPRGVSFAGYVNFRIKKAAETPPFFQTVRP
ncbi:hypothetical protein CMR26_12675 [Bacillus velezensis]|nr:hypothetical protein CMR26_12675 [Bacillus velezensis]PRS84355.1 hypothetical protein C6355_14935 [Bacillus velezensis]RKW72840.1 hypothetical protein D5S11_15165 [Bacillus sp. L75]